MFIKLFGIFADISYKASNRLFKIFNGNSRHLTKVTDLMQNSDIHA